MALESEIKKLTKVIVELTKVNMCLLNVELDKFELIKARKEVNMNDHNKRLHPGLP